MADQSESADFEQPAIGCAALYKDRSCSAGVGSRFLLGLIAAGFFALLVDVPVARVLVHGRALRWLHGPLGALEPFGQPAAVLFVALAIVLCDPQRRAGVPRFLAASLGAGLAADIVKLLVARARPHHFDLTASVAASFHGILPGVSGGSTLQSCPSAHTAVATGFCLALSRYFPAGRPLFVFGAVCVALQRVESGAHFVSDTVWGAAVACALGLALYDRRFFGDWFEGREHAARERRSDASELVPRLAVVSGGNEVPVAELSEFSRPQSTPTQQFAGMLLRDTDDLRSLSVVIPLFDEEDNLRRLHSSLSNALHGLQMPYELIFVDDGSRDRSAAELASLADADAAVTVLTFAENCGQSLALLAGIRHARGDAIALMDADLQNDPADLPQMLARLRAGCDLVHGWRRRRNDRFLDRRLPSLAANWLISRVTGYRLHDTGCTLKVLRRELAQTLPLFGGLHRFIPALAHARGARCVEVPARHHARTFGRSKYGLSRIVRVLADLVLVKYLSTAICRERTALERVARLTTIRQGRGLAATTNGRGHAHVA